MASSEDERRPVTEMAEAWTPPPAPDTRPPATVHQYRPHCPAPEQTARMSAMRALANDTTRSAIATHTRRHLYSQTSARAMAAIGVLSGACLVSLAFREDRWWATVGLLTGLFAGGFGLSQIFVYYRRQSTSGSSPEADVAPPADEPPVDWASELADTDRLPGGPEGG